MEKFELTDFSGGQQERFSAADFKPNEWAKLKGFVVEDARTIRSQWAIQDVGDWQLVGRASADGVVASTVRVQSLAGLSTNSGVDYLFGWLYTTDIDPFTDVGTWRLVYKRVSYKNIEPASVTGNAWQSEGDGLAIYFDMPVQNYSTYWKDTTLDSTTTDWDYVRKSDGSIVQYGADDGSNVLDHTKGPRFICTVPYYNVTGTATTGLLVSCTAAGNETKSYLVYEGSGYNGSPIVVKEYTNYLPSATSDTDANGDGILDNGGALVVSSDVMPRANVGVYWRGQLILGDVEYFTNPKAVEDAHSEAYTLYVAAYKDWLAAKDAYKSANGQTASYPITAPTAIATIQPNRGIDYINAYKTYIVAWAAKFAENKPTSSNTGFPTAPSTGSYAAGSVKRYRNGLWFSQPGTIDQFHPFAFTADVCPADAQIVGFVPVEDGLLVITTSTTKDAVILLRGPSFGYMADDQAVINVRVETVSGAIGSKSIDSALAPPRACYWPKNSSAVYIGRDGSVQVTNGSQLIKADAFKAAEPVVNESPQITGSLDARASYLATLATSGNLPAYDQVYAFKNYIFLSRGFRWYVMAQLEDNSFAWSELEYPFQIDYLSTEYTNAQRAARITPKHMVDVGGNLYFIAWDGKVFRLNMNELEAELSSTRGSITRNYLSTTKYTTTRARSSGIATVGVDSTSGITVGMRIYVSNLGANYDGLRTVTTILASPARIQFACGAGSESQTADTDGVINCHASTVSYPELTISTPTLQDNDYYNKSFWHRVGVRIKQVYNSTSGTLVRIVTRNAPANAVTSVSDTVTLNTAVTERGELVAPALGPSVEFSADIVFTGDVSVEGVAVYKHGKVPRRQ